MILLNISFLLFPLTSVKLCDSNENNKVFYFYLCGRKLKSMKEYLRFIRFALFSASAGLIEILVFALLNEIGGWSYWPCYLTALLCSILWNFTFNRNFTFRSVANVPTAMIKVLGFYAIFTPATTLLGSYLADTLLWNEYLVTGINMGLNFVTEYFFQRYVVYRTSIDTRK